MKLSKTFWQTYKEAPKDAEIPSHILMMRAGLLHKGGSGLYNYLPFAVKTIRKVENIIREELDAIDSNEITMSVVTPGELWQETGRWDKMGDLMLKFKDKGDKNLCISPTNEEAVTDIFRKAVTSYKNLPVSVYQINTKFRDEIRPRFGLMRGREFVMKDAYTFHADKACMDEIYEDFYRAYTNIFTRIGLEFAPVEADGGAIASADSKTHEFQVIAERGEDEIVYSEETGYAANIEKAQTIRQGVEAKSPSGESRVVETPGKATIKDVCEFLGEKEHHSIKSLLYVFDGDEGKEFYMCLLLGDDQLNDVKLAAIAGGDCRPATDNEMESFGLVKGFMGPNGNENVKVLIDKMISVDGAYVIGGNQENMHTVDYVISKDLKDYTISDLRTATEGDKTLDGKGTVKIKRGIEVGHIFQLGNKYTGDMGVTIQGSDGRPLTPLMGCYGIGVTRVVAAAIEQSHDEKGIVWPKAIAPFQVHFVSIAKSDEVKAVCEDVYQELRKNFEVIYDDRKAGPGFKFKDADLLGVPLQVVLGERNFKEDGSLKIVVRKTGEEIKTTQESLVSDVARIWEGL